MPFVLNWIRLLFLPIERRMEDCRKSDLRLRVPGVSPGDGCEPPSLPPSLGRSSSTVDRLEGLPRWDRRRTALALRRCAHRKCVRSEPEIHHLVDCLYKCKGSQSAS